MTIKNKIQYAFTAGEVSPSFYGRTDLTKYELGAQLISNYFVGYRGGLISRPGSRVVAEVQPTNTETKYFRFKATGNDYLLVFGHLNMRIIRAGGYLLEATKNITGLTSGTPLVVDCAGHGYTTGDLIFINGSTADPIISGRYWEVGATNTNDFELLNPDGTNFDGTGLAAYGTGGTVAKTVTVTTPYSSSELFDLRAEQRFSSVTLTTLDKVAYRLTYVNDTSWTLAAVTIGTSTAAPDNVTLTSSTSGAAGLAVGVTAVVDDIEGELSEYAIKENSVDYGTTVGSLYIEWDSVLSATEYNVYRSLILPTGTEISKAQELGYIGRAFGTQFTDTNIIPDFTKTPPRFFNPFSNGTILHVNMTAAGSSYAKSDTVNVTGGGGTGFSGYPIINNAGEIISVVVVNGGSGYSGALTVTFTTSTGSSATATATAGSASGNNPRIFRMFQQRGIYLGTLNQPMTLFGSKPNAVDNFDNSTVVTAGDGYQFTLDADEVNPIYHAMSLRSGLLIFTATSVSLMRAEEGKAVSAINALAEPQAYKGASLTEPVSIGLDVVFVQEQSTSVNAMQFTEYTNTFKMQDVSVLSEHLMGDGKRITRMTYAAEPHKLIWALREDGVLLSQTYEREQEVFAWAQHYTRGAYTDIMNIRESNKDVLYMAVERYINGKWRKFIEVQQPREATIAEDHWGVDCGLDHTLIQPAFELQLNGYTGADIVATASGAYFSANNVGDIIYCGGGKLEVTAYTSTTQIVCTALRDVTVTVPHLGDRPWRFVEGNWEIGTPTTELTGLHHLEGESVSVLADGDVIDGLTVSNGQIILPQAATKIRAGLAYNCDLTTLPITLSDDIAEGKRKDVIGASVRLKDTRGLSHGATFSALQEMKDRTSEDWGEAIGLRNGQAYVTVNSAWDTDVTISFRQANPLPATILSLVYDVQVGDEDFASR